MKNFLLILNILFIACSTPLIADEFYLISGKTINLKITNLDNTVNYSVLDKDNNITLSQYLEVCIKSDTDYEVGIIGKEDISLKPEYPCLNHLDSQPIKKEKNLSEYLTFEFSRIRENLKEKLRIVPVGQRFIIAQGRGMPIKISKSKNPKIKIDFKEDNIRDSINLKKVRGKSIIIDQEITEKSIIFNSLRVGDIYIIKIKKTDGGKDIQRFEIIE